jgi:hypothetical protein
VTEPSPQHDGYRWDPLNLDKPLAAYVDEARSAIISDETSLDEQSCMNVLDAGQKLFDRFLPDLISDDTLPVLSHTYLAVGDNPIYHSMLLARIAGFADYYNGQRRIRQHNDEGDFHPWQSFAYIAIVEPESSRLILFPDGTSIRDIAKASTDLAVDQGEELGHALLATSLLFDESNVPKFWFDGAELDVEAALTTALQAQWFGHFNVCRKFHLTEGIISLVARYPSLRRYEGLASGALAGQYSVLDATTVLTKCLFYAEHQQIIEKLRLKLGLSDLFQDHLFYAGHLLEICNLATAAGYSPPPAAVVHALINPVNIWLNSYLSTLPSPRECLVQASHYFRGLKAYLKTTQTHPNNPVVHQALTCVPPQEIPFAADRIDQLLPRPEFAAAVLAFNSSFQGKSLSGTFSHFRRWRPESWPRPLHYELLDYGGWIGAELHIESDDCLWVKHILCQMASSMCTPSGCERIEFDSGWWGGRGRLRALFPPRVDPVAVSAGLEQLITFSEPIISHLLKQQNGVKSPVGPND